MNKYHIAYIVLTSRYSRINNAPRMLTSSYHSFDDSFITNPPFRDSGLLTLIEIESQHVAGFKFLQY